MDRRGSSPSENRELALKGSRGKSKQKQAAIPRRKQEEAPMENMMRMTSPENISFPYDVVGPFRRLFASPYGYMLYQVGKAHHVL